jgi:hypothetical protein
MKEKRSLILIYAHVVDSFHSSLSERRTVGFADELFT